MRQINLRLADELLQRIDEARGDVSRNRWLTRAAETQLNLGIIVPGTPEGDRLAELAERHRSSADAKRNVAPIPRKS